MRTNIEIDDNLMKQAMEYSKLKTKKEIVDAGLKELIRTHAIKELLKLKGNIDFFDNYEPRIEE